MCFERDLVMSFPESNTSKLPRIAGVLCGKETIGMLVTVGLPSSGVVLWLWFFRLHIKAIAVTVKMRPSPPAPV